MADEKAEGRDHATVLKYTPGLIAELTARLGHEPTAEDLREFDARAADGSVDKWLDDGGAVSDEKE